MDLLDEVRHFNRLYLGRLGLYSRDYLHVGLSVTELRVYHEIASGTGAARDIARTLDLDEGYLSRILRRFTEKGWLESRPEKADARRKRITLTARGEAFLAELEARVRAETGRRLGEVDLPALVSALRAVELLLEPPAPEAVTYRDPRPGDLGWAISRNGETYHGEQGMDASFELYVAEILLNLRKSFDPARHAAIFACLGEMRLGCIFLEPGEEPGVAKLRVFFVEPAARGLGLGRGLVERCIAAARARGYGRIELMTLDTQTAARHLYARHGFRLIKSFPVRLAGLSATEEKWALDL